MGSNLPEYVQDTLLCCTIFKNLLVKFFFFELIVIVRNTQTVRHRYNAKYLVRHFIYERHDNVRFKFFKYYRKHYVRIVNMVYFNTMLFDDKAFYNAIFVELRDR